MDISKNEYAELIKRFSPNTNIAKTMPSAFVFGGGICVLGQMLYDGFSAIGVKQEFCYASVSCTIVIITAFLTGLGLFDEIAKRAGAGALVPISGFANAVSAPAIEFKTEGFILGVGAKMFVIAGPVIVYGVLSSVAYGLIIWAFGLY